jgi:N-acetylmuramoyl-L-alanine amidase
LIIFRLKLIKFLCPICEKETCSRLEHGKWLEVAAKISKRTLAGEKKALMYYTYIDKKHDHRFIFMKREIYLFSGWTTQRIKDRMLQDIFEENLCLNGLDKKKSRPRRSRGLILKAMVLFLVFFSFAVYKNSDFGDYHTLPALPLARYMTIQPDSPPAAPQVPLAASSETAGVNYSEYQPFLSQGNFSLRAIFGLKVRTIVIDPGHGGEDPGTSGHLGTREKDITLDIAKRLQQRLNRYSGYQILLTRSEDAIVSLEARIEFANTHNADLFVSIHVNNIPNKPYSIIETYYFGPNSDRGVLSLAEKENSGAQYAMNDFKAMVQKINHTLKFQEAKVLADYGVKTAPFIVLLGVDMPSVLTEVTCLSNQEEEKKLNNEAYRRDIARYMEEGIIQYLQIKSNPIKSEV